MEVLGIFSDKESAGIAVEHLIKDGFVERQITSLTSVAYPDGVIVRTEQRTWFRWFTLACGIAGAGAGFLLAAGTAWLYPVKTGDKPIIAFYPTGIVTYELTMLFALVGTIIGMFLEMGLPTLRKRVYDPLIAEGYVGISVSMHSGGEAVACGADVLTRECIGAVAALPPDEQASRAEEIMKAAGAVRTIAEDRI